MKLKLEKGSANFNLQTDKKGCYSKFSKNICIAPFRLGESSA